MTLAALQYWGEAVRRWDLEGLSLTLTQYPAYQVQTRHRHENPTYFFLLRGEFSDVSPTLGHKCPRTFDLLFHPAGAWHESVSGDTGRFGLNIEPSAQWLAKFGLFPNDLGHYRVDSDPARSLELLRLVSLSDALSQAEEQLLETLLPGDSSLKEPPAWFQRIDELVEPEAGAYWTLCSLAKELGVHPVYLARVFRSRNQCSVTEWLLQKRLLRAARSLMDGCPVSEVAYDAGFADQSHFGRVFRAQLRCTPRDFRRHWA